MKRAFLVTSLLLTSFGSFAGNSTEAESANGLFGTFTAKPPFGMELTNQVGYPYTLTVYNRSDAPVVLDNVNIKFSTANWYCAYVDHFVSFSTKTDNIYVKTNYMGNEPIPFFDLTLGSPINLPDELKSLQPNAAISFDVVSPESLGSGTMGSPCIMAIEQSITITTK